MDTIKGLAQIIEIRIKSLKSLDKSMRITLEFNASEIESLRKLLEAQADQMFDVEFKVK